MNYHSGIDWDSELKKYQEKAKKWDRIVALAKEERDCRAKIKSIAQERSKLIGVVME